MNQRQFLKSFTILKIIRLVKGIFLIHDKNLIVHCTLLLHLKSVQAVKTSFDGSVLELFLVDKCRVWMEDMFMYLLYPAVK